MTGTDDTRIIYQTERDGMIRCLHDTWEDQKSCSLAQKPFGRDECLYYGGDLDHCWLPKTD